jgi:hypothetical protein
MSRAVMPTRKLYGISSVAIVVVRPDVALNTRVSAPGLFN